MVTSEDPDYGDCRWSLKEIVGREVETSFHRRQFFASRIPLPSGKHTTKLLKMAKEIVDLPVPNGDFP